MGGQKVVKSDKCIWAFLNHSGARARAAPKVYATPMNTREVMDREMSTVSNWLRHIKSAASVGEYVSCEPA